MPTVEISDQTLAALHERSCSECGVDIVLREILGLRPPRDRRLPLDITLIPLLNAGLIVKEDEFIWHRERLKHQHHATVTADGLLRLRDGSLHRTPDRAASVLAGYPIYSWRQWHRITDGARLVDLRDALVR
ncbi:hypothetical protein [Nonomuraea insulae]|uniref:RAMA domain-containing protein n=1 Tax=Nonomuraea insulae TaxID=1616787 RepID=A0ABW1CUC2_9ACTN